MHLLHSKLTQQEAAMSPVAKRLCSVDENVDLQVKKSKKHFFINHLPAHYRAMDIICICLTMYTSPSRGIGHQQQHDALISDESVSGAPLVVSPGPAREGEYGLLQELVEGVGEGDGVQVCSLRTR
jgi:hypothetical protein